MRWPSMTSQTGLLGGRSGDSRHQSSFCTSYRTHLTAVCSVWLDDTLIKELGCSRTGIVPISMPRSCTVTIIGQIERYANLECDRMLFRLSRRSSLVPLQTESFELCDQRESC
ncbi:hypothetical protein TNCV_4035291 [Trichonephila clavipes]|nr:hypothetical protein TNCV_4035291 [Trichonephila clavipes]